MILRYHPSKFVNLCERWSNKKSTTLNRSSLPVLLTYPFMADGGLFEDSDSDVDDVWSSPSLDVTRLSCSFPITLKRLVFSLRTQY